MEITIRKMETEEEIRGKAYVHWQSWHEAYPGIIDPAALERMTRENCERIAFSWPDGLLVAKDGDNVIGFVGYGHREEDPPEVGEIFALYVLKEYYGKSVGRQLMQAGLEQLRDYKEICLWTLKDNHRAIRFYNKCGFFSDGQEKYNSRLKAREIRMILAERPQ